MNYLGAESSKYQDAFEKAWQNTLFKRNAPEEWGINPLLIKKNVKQFSNDKSK